jgi:hypothetical protein
MSAPSFLDCGWERVVWFTRGLSIHPGKEPALSTGCTGGRISDVYVDVMTEREKGYVAAEVETREHTHSAVRVTVLFEVPQRTHVRQYTHCELANSRRSYWYCLKLHL